MSRSFAIFLTTTKISTLRAWTTRGSDALREEVSGADALLFVTPEYNGGLPSAIKNAVDWVSRPKLEGAIKGKPSAAISASTGQFGGVWAQDHLRKVLGDCRRPRRSTRSSPSQRRTRFATSTATCFTRRRETSSQRSLRHSSSRRASTRRSPPLPDLLARPPADDAGHPERGGQRLSDAVGEEECANAAVAATGL